MADPDFLRAELEKRRAAGLARRVRRIDGAQDRWIEVDGRRALLLCSNNYLGLANHPQVIEAAATAAHDYGVGSGASRLISGSTPLHDRLEEELADLKRSRRALLFNSGYQANLGAITALVGAEDEIFSDELNHASLIDGCRLSKARIRVYPHNDTGVLREHLRASRARRRLIVTDSVFSMDGDVAPLPTICDLAEEFGAMVMVDEAHATGVLGTAGAGAVAALGLSDRITVQMGTLGKALGTFGAFVCGSDALVELLLNTARSFVFTTALPAPVVAAARAALDIARREDRRRHQLRRNADRLLHGLLALGFDVPQRLVHPAEAEPTHIVPLMIGDAHRTMEMSEALLEAGVFAQGVRPPTVPAGTSRLRVTLMATHTDADIDHALEAFAAIATRG